MIEVKQISSKRDQKKFFKFLIDLYKGNPYAAPNLYADEFAEFDPKQNDAFRFCECKMFLAYKDGKIVGRIAGILHKGVNEKYGYKQLRFTRFDVIDDFEVTKALFAKLYDWARETGMEEIIGPMSFSDLNEEGMLIDGFDQDSCYIELYNYPYYVEHMEKLGAYKVVDWHCFRIEVPEKVDERNERLANAIMKRNNYTVLDVAWYLKHDKKELDRYIMEALHIHDDVYSDLYGTSPLNDKQLEREMRTVYQILLPELACVVLKDDHVVAYGFCMPSMTKVMQKARGSVIPRALFEYIKAMKHPKVADMMAIGVRRDEANKGSVAVIINHIEHGMIKLGIEHVECGPELETNAHVQNLWKNNYKGYLAKRRRCWGLKVD